MLFIQIDAKHAAFWEIKLIVKITDLKVSF